jgi:hypothetical protein
MKKSQADLRKRVAEKTHRIVDRQQPLSLEAFLAQGQKRSRQQRKPLAGELASVR